MLSLNKMRSESSVSEYVFLEAIVIGIAFVLLFFIVHWIAMKFVGEGAMMNHLYLAIQVFTTAAVLHLICEFTGANEWYRNNHK